MEDIVIDKVYEALDKNEFLATNKIALKVKLNWYKVNYILQKLLEQEKVETISLGKGIFWKKK